MGSKFYSSTDEQTGSQAGPLIPAVIKKSPEMATEVLPNGNQIIESLQVTETIHTWRNCLINQVDSIKAEWGTQKSAFRNELASTKEYLEKNIFTDIYENRELLVPSSILSLGAFFSGRVLSNKANWGNQPVLVKPHVSLIGRLFTSLPSRVLLPFVLAGTVFHQITPISSSNLWKTIERDALPRQFVDESHRWWREYYINGFLRQKERFSTGIYANLQNGISSLRKSISEVVDH